MSSDVGVIDKYVKIITADAAGWDYGTIGWTIDGAGATISVGMKAGGILVPFNGTIVSADLVLDKPGNVVVNIFKDAFPNWLPTLSEDDSICTGVQLTTANTLTSRDSTLGGWTTTVTKGDYYVVSVDSATNATWATVTLYIRKRQ